MPLSNSLIDRLRLPGDIDGADLLALATEDVIAELDSLVGLAETQLLPTLAIVPGPWFVGPVFPANQWMDAEADLIAGHTLVEIKTNLGRMTGRTRVPDLSLETLRQLVGYLLHDTDDTYRIDRIGIYEARFGTLTTWPLRDFLDQLSGREIDLAEAPQAHAEHLIRGPKLSDGDPPPSCAGTGAAAVLSCDIIG